MRRDMERVQDMLDAIAHIERYIYQGREAFEQEELIQIWTIHHIQIIGEAARSISESFRSLYDTVPWSEIIGMRHILVHNYFGIDLDTVWVTAYQNIPTLKLQLEEILQTFTPDNPDPL